MFGRAMGRAFTVCSLAAVTAWASAATAMAGPPSQVGVARSTTGYASAFLGSTEVFIPFDVFAPSRTDPFGTAEILVQGYECFPQNTVGASVDGLTSATASGVMVLACSFHQDPNEPPQERPDVVGTAHVDLTWTGEGPVDRMAVAGRNSSCVGLLQIRHAVVTGEVHVVIPDLGVDQVASTLGDDDDSLRYEKSICRPGR